MPKIYPTGPDTFQYVEDETATPQERASNFRSPIPSGTPLHTGGGYSAPQSGWEVAEKEMTGPDTFQVTLWRNRFTGDIQTESPSASGGGGGQASSGGGGGGLARTTTGSASGPTTITSNSNRRPAYESGWAATESAPAYRGAPLAHSYQPSVEESRIQEFYKPSGVEGGRGSVNQYGAEPQVRSERVEPRVTGRRQERNNYEDPRLEPQVKQWTGPATPEIIQVNVPDYSEDPRLDPQLQEFYRASGAGGGRGSVNQYGAEPQTQLSEWDPGLAPPTIMNIPKELQAWADQYGMELTPKQLEQYAAIEAGGWR